MAHLKRGAISKASPRPALWRSGKVRAAAGPRRNRIQTVSSAFLNAPERQTKYLCFYSAFKKPTNTLNVQMRYRYRPDPKYRAEALALHVLIQLKTSVPINFRAQTYKLGLRGCA